MTSWATCTTRISSDIIRATSPKTSITSCKTYFVFMLGFYYNFSITSPKKISCKFFTMFSKTQRIFITEHYLHSNYRTKMSDTFTFNRTEFVPIGMSEQIMELLHEFFDDRFVSVGLWPHEARM